MARQARPAGKSSCWTKMAAGAAAEPPGNLPKTGIRRQYSQRTTADVPLPQTLKRLGFKWLSMEWHQMASVSGSQYRRTHL